MALTNRTAGSTFPIFTGIYEVSVEKQAFTKYVQGPIVLRVSQPRTCDSVELAAVTDKVTVREDASL
jgi:hypothetical protein